MSIVKLTKKEDLDELYNSSRWTWEGMDDSEDNLKEIEEYVRNNGYDYEDFTVNVFTGELMNEVYNLTGKNRYKKDLTFVSIPNYYNVKAKLDTGARWFDDIVDNNSRREKKYEL